MEGGEEMSTAQVVSAYRLLRHVRGREARDDIRGSALASVLGVCYAMSGTDVASAATRSSCQYQSRTAGSILWYQKPGYLSCTAMFWYLGASIVLETFCALLLIRWYGATRSEGQGWVMAVPAWPRYGTIPYRPMQFPVLT
eukprot:221939-Rhodomonas_salina.1